MSAALANKMIETGTDIQGDLPPEVIKRIVRSRFPSLRFCYQTARAKNPKLAGTVSTKFTIDEKGEVASATSGGGTITDEAMTTCVLDVFKKLTFPQPSSGKKVLVTYPIDFQNDGDEGEPLTITRLHARYSPKTLGDDLVFQVAPPVVGGRERFTDGKIEKGAVPAMTNAFQGRYVIRHPWTGPMKCEKPVRNRWGGPPAGTPNTGASPAKDLAHAPRTNVQLASMVVSGLDDVKSWDEAAKAAPVAAPPVLEKKPVVHARRRACHCEVGFVDEGAGALPFLGLLAAAASRRRNRPRT